MRGESRRKGEDVQGERGEGEGEWGGREGRNKG